MPAAPIMCTSASGYGVGRCNWPCSTANGLMRPLPPVPNPPRPEPLWWNASDTRLRDWLGQHQRDRHGERDGHDGDPRRRHRGAARAPGPVRAEPATPPVQVVSGVQGEQDQVPDGGAEEPHPRDRVARHRARDGVDDEQRHAGQRAAPSGYRDQVGQRGEQADERAQHEPHRGGRVDGGDAVARRLVQGVEQARDVGDGAGGRDEPAPGVRRDEQGGEPRDEQQDAGPDVERAGAAVAAQQRGRRDDDGHRQPGVEQPAPVGEHALERHHRQRAGEQGEQRRSQGGRLVLGRWRRAALATGSGDPSGPVGPAASAGGRGRVAVTAGPRRSRPRGPWR